MQCALSPDGRIRKLVPHLCICLVLGMLFMSPDPVNSDDASRIGDRLRQAPFSTYIKDDLSHSYASLIAGIDLRHESKEQLVAAFADPVMREQLRMLEASLRPLLKNDPVIGKRYARTVAGEIALDYLAGRQYTTDGLEHCTGIAILRCDRERHLYIASGFERIPSLFGRSYDGWAESWAVVEAGAIRPLWVGGHSKAHDPVSGTVGIVEHDGVIHLVQSDATVFRLAPTGNPNDPYQLGHVGTMDLGVGENPHGEILAAWRTDAGAIQHITELIVDGKSVLESRLCSAAELTGGGRRLGVAGPRYEFMGRRRTASDQVLVYDNIDDRVCVLRGGDLSTLVELGSESRRNELQELTAAARRLSVLARCLLGDWPLGDGSEVGVFSMPVKDMGGVIRWLTRQRVKYACAGAAEYIAYASLDSQRLHVQALDGNSGALSVPLRYFVVDYEMCGVDDGLVVATMEATHANDKDEEETAYCLYFFDGQRWRAGEDWQKTLSRRDQAEGRRRPTVHALLNFKLASAEGEVFLYYAGRGIAGNVNDVFGVRQVFPQVK